MSELFKKDHSGNKAENEEAGTKSYLLTKSKDDSPGEEQERHILSIYL